MCILILALKNTNADVAYGCTILHLNSMVVVDDNVGPKVR